MLQRSTNFSLRFKRLKPVLPLCTRGRAARLGLAALALLVCPPLALGLNAISPRDISRGMKGVGKSVFVGTQVEEFQVEVLGVVWNNLAKTDMILCRLSGQNLEHSGTVAGMSGSPIYIEGRLAGALAYGYMFSKDPIVGVTPIGPMLDVMKEDMTKKPWRRVPPSHVNPAAGKEALQQWWNSAALPFRGLESGSDFLPNSTFLPDAGSMMPLATPLVLSGVPASVVEEFRDQFYQRGWVPLAMPGGARKKEATHPVVLEPGASVGVGLLSGDIDAAAVGTLTWQDGDRFVAFGHPMDQAGSTDLPFNATYVVHVMAMLNRSFKLGYALEPLGSLRQDRTPGVAGSMARRPRCCLSPSASATSRPAATTASTTRSSAIPPYLSSMVQMGVMASLDYREARLGPLRPQTPLPARPGGLRRSHL
ncbi:hypothetical protein HS125_18180 [bacterium]|nr:hypothetical protein [bacterium]